MNKELFLKSLEGVKGQFEAMRGDSTLAFAVFSDLHTTSPDAEMTEELMVALKEICQQLSLDAVIDLGDNPAMLGRNHHITNEDLIIFFKNLFDKMKQAAGCPLLLINGNHDAVGTDFFKPELWNSVTKGIYDDSLATYAPQGSYYYVDFERANTRLVFLSLPHDSDLTGVHPAPLWSFGEKQLTWLKKEALNTEKTVLLFCHEPFYYAYHGSFGPNDTLFEVWDGEKVTKTPVINLCGWIDDLDEVVSIVEKSGRVAACFSGHTHQDSLWMPHEQHNVDINPLPCYQVVTRNPVETPWDKEDMEIGVAIDILVWDGTSRTIRMLRVGDGQHRDVPCLL